MGRSGERGGGAERTDGGARGGALDPAAAAAAEAQCEATDTPLHISLPDRKQGSEIEGGGEGERGPCIIGTPRKRLPVTREDVWPWTAGLPLSPEQNSSCGRTSLLS